MKPRQDALTSEKAMLRTAMLCFAIGSLSCSILRSPQREAPELVGPYQDRQIWAVAPLRNESGSTQVEVLDLADHLARQLEGATNIDVLPLNRTLAAMEGLRLAQVNDATAAKGLRRTLGANGLVVGTVTAYDPYDPPKLGLAIELYRDADPDADDSVSARALRWAATEPQTLPEDVRPSVGSGVSAFFDAADPRVREQLQVYATRRGAVDDPGSWHRYRKSMALFTEFVSYTVIQSLLREEAQQMTVTIDKPIP